LTIMYFKGDTIMNAVIEKITHLIPDAIYVKMLYRIRMHYPLNLKEPKSFNEKLQWIKLYDRNPLYTKMVDKYEAKGYVSNLIGEEHIIPTLGVWNRFDDIDFDSLPDQFVLKCTHDSGGLVIVRNKSSFDRQAAKEKIEQSLKTNYYWHCREWPYKDVKPRIIAEKYMENHSENGDTGLIDYKFYCFGGEPRFLYVSKGLENHKTASISFVTCDWEFAPYERKDFKPFSVLPNKPQKFDEMLIIAKELSKGFDFLRVDLYEIDNMVYFSELTFTPCGGFMPFKEKSQDLEMGRLLKISHKL
ncbi:MAG: ATP-grasp fold amidoligase family protein, partial [Acutalibacteraceae bacterium]